MRIMGLVAALLALALPAAAADLSDLALRGVRLGQSPTEVKSALQAAGYHVDEYLRSYKAVPDQKFASHIDGWIGIIPPPYPSEDAMVVYFTPPPGPPRVMAIWRGVTYSNPADRPTVLRLMNELGARAGDSQVWLNLRTDMQAYFSADTAMQKFPRTARFCALWPIPTELGAARGLRFNQMDLPTEWRLNPAVDGRDGVPTNKACKTDLRLHVVLDRPVTATTVPGVSAAFMLLTDHAAVAEAAAAESTWIAPLEAARIQAEEKRRAAIVPAL